MAKLTSASRNALPDSAFAIPEERKYPIPDRSHAGNALSRVSANGDQEEKAQVRAAVRRRFKGMAQEKKTK
jgi:hypothetical protein